MANGKQDYIKMVNARDGGINGVKLTYEEASETATPPTGGRGVLRTPEGRPGVTLFDPQATGITLRYRKSGGRQDPKLITLRLNGGAGRPGSSRTSR
jgi:branched-chain amino acid transport system substrate-binding protein